MPAVWPGASSRISGAAEEGSLNLPPYPRWWPRRGANAIGVNGEIPSTHVVQAFDCRHPSATPYSEMHPLATARYRVQRRWGPLSFIGLGELARGSGHPQSLHRPCMARRAIRGRPRTEPLLAVPVGYHPAAPAAGRETWGAESRPPALHWWKVTSVTRIGRKETVR
jgi:hypothetical protein